MAFQPPPAPGPRSVFVSVPAPRDEVERAIGGLAFRFPGGLRLASRRETARGVTGLVLPERELRSDPRRLAGAIAFLSGRFGPGLTFELVQPGADPQEVELPASRLEGLIAAGEPAPDVRYVVVSRS